MRLLVLFDMPVEKAAQRKEYVRFRKKIMDDGFMMLQFSVYSRYCNNDSDAEKHIKRVKELKPKYGNIRILKVTENQFESMILVQGEKTAQERLETDEQLTVI
ncbi:MAG: CRISPR-associated endonuclease Cas2 [Firmicutes bacterium]|uniref:CRISPR-associated endoribonuclease Cas2 n=1 Tax=Candidatus Alloenteromonas pullistercoris TaxID=2840785 RepID=A0A9D9DFH7_9FIRM|nr:CRISPR-associated endonuclease Cas2 [Candidatus Enteromonas pullistercoris]